MGQGSQMLSLPGGPTVEEPDIFPQVNAAAIEEGTSLGHKGHDLASPARAVDP